jgi:nucleoside diphosphate kinase
MRGIGLARRIDQILKHRRQLKGTPATCCIQTTLRLDYRRPSGRRTDWQGDTINDLFTQALLLALSEEAARGCVREILFTIEAKRDQVVGSRPVCAERDSNEQRSEKDLGQRFFQPSVFSTDKGAVVAMPAECNSVRRVLERWPGRRPPQDRRTGNYVAISTGSEPRIAELPRAKCRSGRFSPPQALRRVGLEKQTLA